MPSIFISYRRSDSQDVAGRIYDRLVNRFAQSQVFKDVDNIPLGVPFTAFLQQTLADTRVVLVLIGPRWLTATDERGRRRLDDPSDYVRLEIETALGLGKPLVPLTVSNAGMPSAAELPASLRPLVAHNGSPVRPDPDFHSDMDRLIVRLAGILGSPAGPVPAGAGRHPESEDLVHRLWDSFEPELQDALSLAYNQARREGKTRISTRTFFAAVTRLRPAPLRPLLDQLPESSLPEPIGEEVPTEGPILGEEPQLSSCVENALVNLSAKTSAAHRLTTADVFVDVAKHGTGRSVAVLREHGVTGGEIDRMVGQLGMRITHR